MDRNSNMKRFTTITIVALLTVSFAAPHILRAQTDRPERTGPNFCSRIEGEASKLGERLTNQLSKIREHQTAAASRLETKRDELETKRDELRAAHDARIAAHIAKLGDRAQTDTQKLAVAAFQTAVTNAIDARRDAYDAAIRAFHDGTNQILQERKTAIDGRLASAKEKYDAAAAKANADCAAGTAPRAVREAFVSAIKSAKNSSDAVKSAHDTFKAKFEALKEARKTAVKAAHDAFRAAVEAARNTLKTALGERKNASTTPE